MLYSTGWGQAPTVAQYSTDDGLIQSQVRAILQDKQGYLWLGTHRGVSRFDGREFLNFEPSQKSDELIGTFISGILEDQKGNLWFASDQGLSKYDGLRFTNFQQQDGLSSNRILCLHQRTNGDIWIGTREAGLTIYKNGTFTKNPIRWPVSQVKRSINSILEDQNNTIWLGTDDGLWTLEENTLVQVETPFLPGGTRVLSLLKLEETLWVGTNVGLFAMDGGNFRSFSEKDGLPDNSVFCLQTDALGRLWAGTGEGIAFLSKGKFEQLLGSNQLAYNIRSSTLDREGNLWFGTEGGGAFRLSQGLFSLFNLGNGLSSNLPKSFLEDGRGNIWISTVDKGISIYDGRNFRYLTESNGLGSNDIVFSTKDSQGRFWFASYTNGLSMYDGQFHAYSTQHGLASNAVYGLTFDAEGNLWIGTDKGLNHWNLTTDEITHTTVEGGLIDNTIYYLRFDQDSTLWMGTPRGICRRLSDGTFIRDSIANNVLTILEDHRHHMWLATASGLIHYDGESFRPIRLEEGLGQTEPLPSGANTVIAILLDGHTLWVGTEDGLFVLDLDKYYEQPDQEGYLRHLTRKDGLPSLEINANAAFGDSKGFIWFGTNEGAARINPLDLTKEAQKPEVKPLVHITKVQPPAGIDSWAESGYLLDPVTQLPKNLKLPHSSNRLEVAFSGIFLTNPKGLKYQVWLEGLDTTWTSTTNSSATYANLAPGDYTFKVRVTSSDVDFTQPATFSFSIKPAIYQTWPFRLALIGLMGMIGLVIYWVLSSRTKRKREEERMKNKAEKLALEHQALYAMMNPHFTFNALQSIQFFIMKQDKIAATRFLSSFAKLIRKNLESTKSEFIALGEEVERLNLYLGLEKMRFKDKFNYKVTVEPDIDLAETQIPPMILQPYVENSIKHGIMPLEAEGEIAVDVIKRDEDHLLIRIIDNGIGVEASKARRANRPNQHVSKGMQITQDRLALFGKMTRKEHGVEIKELYHPDGSIAGTEVTMLLPLAIGHGLTFD
ncbi:MAG: two-component regulator propeller domain-containing protein [Bacteroidota bacterium]